jgi:anti-sigma B factor antagonist
MHGAVNVYSASVVGQAIQSLIADGVRTIVLDLTSVSSIDSSGVGTLVGNAKAIASVGGSLRLVGLNDRVRRVLERTNLERYFKIHDDPAEAFRDGEPQTVCETSSKGAL